MSRASNLAGFVSAIYPEDNLSVGFLTARNLNVTGVTTFGGVIDIQGGIAYAEVAGIATYATTAGIATNATSATYAATAGIATVAEGLTGTPDITVGNITAVDGTFAGDVSIAGTVTYQDVTDVNAVGIITAQQGIDVTGGDINITGGGTINGPLGDVTGVSTTFVSAIGIQSGGVSIGVGITQLNFVGTGNTFKVDGTTIDISIEGGGTGGGSTAGTASTGAVFSNPQVVTEDLDLIEPSRNYGMWGPITIDPSATITVGAGNSFTIV